MNVVKKITEPSPAPKFLNFASTGVELSPDGLRFAVFVHDGMGLKLIDFGFTPFSNADIFCDESLSSLRALAEKKHRSIRATIPEESTYLFILPIENDEENISSFIEFHLEENVPISPRDSIFDYLVFFEGDKKYVAVTVISKEVIQKHVDFYAKAGLVAASFIPESRAIAASLVSQSEDTSLVVHIENHKSIISVSKKGVVRFTSAVQSGGSIITDALSKYHSISSEEAEKMKCEIGFDSDDASHGRFMALGNAMSPLRDEIERVMIYWQIHGPFKTAITRIVLSGSEASIPGLLEYLRESLKIEIIKGDVWCSPDMDRYKTQVPEIPFKYSLSYAPVIGLFIS